MPIEFRCPQCRQLMRTPDDSAGKQAKCPQCETLVLIPTVGTTPPQREDRASTSGPSAAGASDDMDRTLPHPGSASDAGQYNVPPPPSVDTSRDNANPYAAPTTYAPLRDATIAAGRRRIVPTQMELGDVFTRSWAIFRDHWLMCALVVFVVQILAQVFSFASGLILGPLAILGAEAGIVLAQVGSAFLTQLFGIWLQLGMTIFFLKVARGQDYQFVDVFLGFRFYIQGVLVSLLMLLILALPMIVCLSPCLFILVTVGESPALWAALVIGIFVGFVPTVYLSLMFWPCVTLVVDQDVDAIEALRLSRAITHGNKLWILLMFIVASGLGIVGILACCVGVFVSSGLTMLMFTVSYLTMTGQPTAETLSYTPATPPGISPAATEPPDAMPGEGTSPDADA